MRLRLLVPYLVLLANAVLALAIPLAVVVVVRESDALASDAVAITLRLHQSVDPDTVDGDPSVLLTRLTGALPGPGPRIAIVDRSGRVAAGPPDVLEGVELSTSGSGPVVSGNRLWPWSSGSVVVQHPISPQLLMVVRVSSVERHRTVIRWWLLIGASATLVLVSGYLGHRPVIAWVLRPLTDLAETTQAINAGQWQTRVPASDGPAELRRLAESFNQMADTVVGMAERQRSFAAQASHQIRNPLAALRLRVENLALAAPSDRLQQEADILDEVDRLTRLCQSLLTLSRADAERVERSLTDVGQVADERYRHWRPTATRAGVQLYRTGSRYALVEAAPTAVDQVLDALIDNAIKYAGPGSQVWIQVHEFPDQVEFAVVDDGPGMTEQELRRAAETFWRAPAGHHIDGSGLGLAIVDALVSASGARLALTSAPGGGLRAVVRMPRAVVRARGRAAVPGPTRPGP